MFNTSRTTRAAVAGLLAAGLLAACGSGGDSAASASSSPAASSAASSSDAGGGYDGPPVTITFWGTYGNGGNKTQTDVLNGTLIPQFQKQHPNITVNYVDIPYDSLLQKLETSAAGEQLPDLVRADIGWVARFADQGVLQQLDGTMPDFQELADATYPGSLSTAKYDDHYYGLPLDTNTRVLISNPEALKKAGLDKPPATVEELATAAPKLAAQNIAVFADSGLQGWNVLPWIWSAGGAITDDNLTTATGYLDSDASVTGVQTLVDLYKAGAIPNLITGNKGGTPTSDGLPSDVYASILDGPWMAGVWSGQYPDFTPVYSPVPAGAGGSVSVVGGEDIVLTADSPNQEAAMEFMRFTQSEDFQVGMAATGQMPVVVAYGDQAAQKYPALAPFAEQLKTAKARPAVPQSNEIDTILNDELTQAFQGTVTVKEALTSAAQQIDPLLSGS